MPHIHTRQNQHDMTVSAYIVLRAKNDWRCLVHYHKKMDVLMQIGGHIELDETPWQAMVHELEEESGFLLSELEVLQHTGDLVNKTKNIQHPVPFTMNTHDVGDEHYHSDLCYGFVAKALPKSAVHEDESTDLRWLTLDELRALAGKGKVLADVVNIYEFLLDHINTYTRVPAEKFSLEKPTEPATTYKRGGAREARQ